MLGIFSGIKFFFGHSKKIDANTFEQLKVLLLRGDINWRLVDDILHTLKKQPINTEQVLLESLKSHLLGILNVAPTTSFKMVDQPQVVFLVGANGAGKTTTLAKLAMHYRIHYQKESVWAAGDTFRAAAVEQLGVWADRLDFKMIRGTPNSDSAAVVYEAYQACIKLKSPILLIDTSGRMHSSDALMRELKKIHQVICKQNAKLKPQVLMVLDATLGQSMVEQVRVFQNYVNLSGLVLTKLDTSSKGGALFSIASELKLPVVFVGTGEGIDDFATFRPDQFVEGLFKG